MKRFEVTVFYFGGKKSEIVMGKSIEEVEETFKNYSIGGITDLNKITGKLIREID